MKLALFPLMQSSILAFAYLYATGDLANAQVTSDGTVNTQVNQTDNVSEITGGETRGDNLFHSFQEFSVRTGNEAFFNNAAAIKNIFSRVTGGNASTIDGLIRANGSASLFLINPAGIIFGEGARLDIGGSFYGSSASSILFDDGEFSATDTQAQPVLTINAPIGLGFRDNPGEIRNQSNFGLTEETIPVDGDVESFTILSSTGLEVDKGHNIALIGGDVILENAGGITAPGGRVELGGLSQAGEITFNEDGSLTFPDAIERGNVTLTGEARVNVTADGGGFINVNAKTLTLSESSELLAGIAENMGSPEAQAGDITINTTDLVNIAGSDSIALPEFQTGIYNDVGDIILIRGRDNNPNLRSNAIGNGGSIKIDTDFLEIDAQGRIATSSLGTGNAGDIDIDANNISINSGAIGSLVRDGGIGDTGNLIIQTTDAIFVGDNSNIQTQVIRSGRGDVGNIAIETSSLTLNEFSFILADNQVEGNAGDITIKARDSISLNGLLSLIISQIQNDVIGNAGNINISSPLVSLSNFSLISTNVKKGSVGRTGDIFMNVGTLRLNDGAVIDALTENNFQGGNININANLLELSDGGKIVTSGESGGNAGIINLDIADDIILKNDNPPTESPFLEPLLQNLASETGLFANTVEGSTGDGGSIVVEANSIQFEYNGSISAATSSGEGGNVTLNIDDTLSLRNDSLISAESSSLGDGGNINIDTNFIVAFPNENNDIRANANRGQGGNIDITAESIFGIEERPLNDLTNDINASSELSLDGTVSITILEPDTIRGTTELPINVIELQQTTEQACGVNPETGEANGLTVKGKGGVPPAPDLPLNSQAIMLNGKDISTQTNQAQYQEIKPIPTSYGDIIPAQGAIVTEDGRVILTAYRTDGNSRVPQGSANCGK